MIKKLVVFLLLVIFLGLPFSVLAQEEEAGEEQAEQEAKYDFASMSTYEMFWPLVPGKVPGDSLYSLKVWRDKLAGLLYFDKLKKSEYLKRLANKRLIESEKLVELERFDRLDKNLDDGLAGMEKGLTFLLSGGDDPNAFWLKEEYQKDLEKHKIVLGRMMEKTSGDQKQKIMEIKDKVVKMQEDLSS